MAEAEQELWADVQPEFAAVHELRSDLPVEDITICSPSFAGSHWSMVLDDPGRWTPDPVLDFAFHRAVLQSVQRRATRAGDGSAPRAGDGSATRAGDGSGPPRQWLLKTPAYLFIMDDLLRAYPDASIVFTHRDPAKTMPSTASATAMIRWLRSDRVDVPQLSELVALLFTAGLNGVAERRHAGTLPASAGHVRFADLMGDPVAAIQSAYDGIGRELTQEHREAVVRYLADKPRAKHGTHDYTAADWGYDADSLRRDLEPYMSTFAVAAEA
jgi:hypothetical protein